MTLFLFPSQIHIGHKASSLFEVAGFLRLAMPAVSLTGRGTDLEAVLSGALALCLGVQINVVILTRALYLNMPAVIMVWTGSKKEDNGLIIQLNLRPA